MYTYLLLTQSATKFLTSCFTLFFNCKGLIRRTDTTPSVQGLATDWTAGFRFPPTIRDFLFLTESRLVLGPTQGPINQVSVAVSSGLKRLESEAYFKYGGTTYKLPHTMRYFMNMVLGSTQPLTEMSTRNLHGW
jgi:hypothetical protein